MKLPFTLDQFLDLFQQYNKAIGIAPPILVSLAALVAGLAFSQYAWRHRVVGLGLAALSFWTGVVYHWMFFTRINPAAWVFGTLCVVQAGLLMSLTVQNRLRFTASMNVPTALGLVLLAYALVGYPLLSATLGHGYPHGPTFGAPCPATIYFFGLTLLAIDSIPVAALVIPVLWAAVATSAALQLDLREDFGLSVSAVLVVYELVHRRAARSNRAQRTVAAAPENPTAGQVRA